MEILLQCPLCKFSYATHPEKKRLGVNYHTVYNTDNNICQLHDSPANHTTTIYLTNYKFDLLFESALNAIKDMYYREAIASLTAAMERFFEFAIYVMTYNINNEEKEKAWKFISNQSERQLGAFCFLFLNKFGSRPDTLNNKDTGFRNSVIHKGYFPTKTETLRYAERITILITETYKILEENLEHDMTKYKQDHVHNLWKLCLELSENGRVLPGNDQYPHSYQLNHKFVKRPFQRRIKTYFFENENFTYRDIESLKKYIQNINTKQID